MGRKRTTYKCPVCRKKVRDITLREGSRIPWGGRKYTENHHIKPKKYGGTDIDINKIKICRGCHWFIHHMYKEKAIQLMLSINPNYFEDTMREIIEGKI